MMTIRIDYENGNKYYEYCVKNFELHKNYLTIEYENFPKETIYQNEKESENGIITAVNILINTDD